MLDQWAAKSRVFAIVVSAVAFVGISLYFIGSRATEKLRHRAEVRSGRVGTGAEDVDSVRRSKKRWRASKRAEKLLDEANI